MPKAARKRARVVLSAPITVAVDDQATGECLCYGVIADLSDAGACVWTNRMLPTGSRLQFRVSFSRPAQVEAIGGRVVWSTQDAAAAGLRRFGVEWQEPPSARFLHLREFALRALDDSLTPSGGLRRLTRAELER